ncbi:MAG: preprotein translocase subunit SecB [Lysobacterales bacterium]|jgi:preprotein translocase subunit SecB
MADDETQVVAEPAANQMQFQLQKIYARDISFELPNAPDVFQDSGQAEIKMNLSQRVNNISDDLFEVILTVTVTALSGEKTAYLAEVHQAGLFLLQGFNDQNRHSVLNTLCPHSLFPYACRVITDLVADGGFPPLVLQPINFEQIYAQRVAEANENANAQQGESTEIEVQGKP